MKKNLLFAVCILTSATCLLIRTRLVLMLTFIVSTSYISSAQPISTIAGNGTQGFSGDGGPATSAQLNFPLGIAVNAAGKYFVDYSNQRVRKIDAAGNISTIAGNGTNGFSGDGGPATSAMLNNPTGVAVDGAGNVYIADRGNHRIRKINTSGIISTFAGNGTAGSNGDSGPATSAELNSPTGVAVDAAGIVYIADQINQKIRTVNIGGFINTIAGIGAIGANGDGGPATTAQLNYPGAVAVDAAGNVYIADKWNNKIRKVNTSGIITTIAGTGAAGYNGDGIPSTSAMLNTPQGVTVDASGNVYIADEANLRVRKVDAVSMGISTIAGTGATGYNGDGIAATSASVYNPYGVAFDGGGNVYISDQSNQRIRKVSPCDVTVFMSSQTNVSCLGGNNGSATAGPTGGTIPYTYAWNTAPAQTTQTATGLYFGTYIVTVTDAGGCTATATVSITQPATALSVSTSGNVTICPGQTTALSASVSGGNSPYTFIWDDGAGSYTGSGITVSPTVTTTYTLTVTDGNSCTAQTNVTVTVTTISISVNTTNVSCNGGSNGSATAGPTGGTSPYTYLWVSGSSSLPTQNISNLPASNWTVTVTDANGCTATANGTITQPTVLNVSTGSNQTICSGGNVGLIGSAGGGTPNYTYNWSPTAGISCTSCGTTGASPTVTTTYTFTATDANGCAAQASVVVTVNPSPSAPIAGSNSPICTGQTLSLTASSTGTTYSWSGPNGFTSALQNPTIGSVTTMASGCYSVTATTNGCASTAGITCVTINQTPAAPTVGSNSPLCAGSTLSLTASSTGTTYSWNAPNSFTSTSQNPTIAGVTTASSGTYSVTATSSAGCISTVGTTSVTVNQIPSAPTASSNSPVNAGNTLSLSASTIVGATYSWSMGAFASSSQNPTIASVTTADAGCYSVTATVNGCTSSAAITCVTVITISITTSTNSVSCNGGNDGGALVVSVTGGNAPYTYSWSTSPVQTTQAIFNLVAGTYTVTVTDASGSSATATVNITQPSPVSVFTNPTNVSCYGGSNGIANAIAGGGTSPYIYSWNSFPVQTTATAANLSAGNYMVTVTDANGCTGTNTVAITQPLALTVSITITNANCGATNGIATANVSGGTAAYSYLWNTAQTTQQISNLSAGTYSVTVTDSKGCTVSSAATIGIIASNFNIAFSGTPQNGPAPLNVTFSNTTPSMSSYNFTWYWGDGNNVSNNNATVFYTYNFSGTYNVALIATSIANGCTDTLVKAPYINVTGAGCTHNATVAPSGPVNACLGDTVILTASTNAVAPFTYQWNIGAVAISGANNSTLAVTQSGYYSVTIIKNNCPVTSSAVQVNFTTLPQQPVITSAGNIVPCVGGSSTLTSSSISGVTYSWNTTPVQTTQSIIVSSSGNYVVTVTNGAGCSTSSAPFIVNASLVQVPICLVTVDSLSQNNIIAWEKQLNQPIDSFIVYREIATNNYQPIGAVLYDSLSLFIDTVRTKYFPNTGDPNSGTYRYKIAVRDTCGNYSPLSPYHNTIYIINNSGTFFWTQLYTIENASNPVTSYDLLRDDNSTGVWNVINSVAGTQQTVTDPNYSTYQSTASWRVKTQWGISCTATIKNPEPMATNLNSSRSNIYKVNNPISVNEAENNFYVNVYPNPTTGKVNVQMSGLANVKMNIYNMMGECIYQHVSTSAHQQIDLSRQSKGVYYLQITSFDKVVTKKIVIE